jgi:hypothetical protein
MQVLNERYGGLVGVMQRNCESLVLISTLDDDAQRYVACAGWEEGDGSGGGGIPTPPAGCTCVTPSFVDARYAGCFEGCVGLTKPEHFEIPSVELQLSDLSFAVLSVSYVNLNPNLNLNPNPKP